MLAPTRVEEVFADALREPRIEVIEPLNELEQGVSTTRP
jgi:hypothetical protein